VTTVRPISPDGAEPRVVVEFVPGVRVSEQDLAAAGSDEIETRSKQALDSAMSHIRAVVERVTGLQTQMPANFKQMQVDFGIKFDWEEGARLANNRHEASITVKLTWDRDTSPDQSAMPTLLAEVPVLSSAEVPITPSGLIQSIGVDQTEERP
jgi:hypothetical protein